MACPVLLCAIACVIPKLAANAVIPVSNPSRLSAWGWLAIPLFALGFLLWTDFLRVRQVEYVSGIGELSGAEPAINASTPAGSATWQPRLIVPGHNNPSYEWLDQTRQMFAHREWRVRHIDYENAPFGREVYAASPYRWWLGLVAWCDHNISGRSLGQSVERGALVADPLLHLLLLLGTVIFTAWRFGVFPAALLSLGLATIFPLAGEFLPGAPDDHGLAQVCAIWSVLPLLAGAGVLHSTVADAGIQARRWFFVAGIMGGLGVWINVSNQVPVIAGIAVGAFMAAWIARGDAQGNVTGTSNMAPWRTWALGGAVTCLAAYLLEFFPSHLGNWELRTIHPLYGLAWIGLGELMAQAVAWIQQLKSGRKLRDIGLVVLAVLAVAALPVAMWRTHTPGFLEVDITSFRLTKLTGGAVATSFWAWLIHDGITTAVCATLLPLLLIGPAVWLLVRRGSGLGPRTSIALALGPVLIALGFACRQLSWWNGLDGVMLALLAAVTGAVRGTGNSRLVRWSWFGFVALLFLPGAVQLIPPTKSGTSIALNESEVLGLIERDLARWLAKHTMTDGAVILAPHNQGFTLHYYGGLRGLATLGWENRNGLTAAMRILSASTPEEAKELIDRRGITYLVIPSWDSYLDTYAQMGMGQLEGTFISPLHQWKLPSWLRPVPYQFPTIAGFEGQSVAILEVVEEQDDAAALSRIAEYFVEMGQLDTAASAAQALRRFPADIGALVARAQVEIARGDTAGFTRTVEQLRSRLSGGADRVLPWDRRVNLAVVLMRGKQADLAREQIRRCLAEVDEARLHSLTTGSLYRLQVLGKAFGLAIADQRLRRLALDLLPSDLRSRL